MSRPRAKAAAAKRQAATLAKLSKICLSLPESVRRDLNEHADFRAIDWSEVQNLVELSYELAAPKSLLQRR